MKKYIFSNIFIFLATIIFAQIRIDTPALVNPIDNAVNLNPDTCLNWNAVIDADAYQFQMSEDESFTIISTDTVTELTCFDTQCLFFNFQYYWRVRAIENQDTSYWTPAWSFTTFAKVTLSKPTNGDDDIEADAVLKWKNMIGSKEISGVEYFNIQIDTEPGFSSPNFAEFTTNGTIYEKKMDQLLFGTEYHWRVRARHDCDTSEWSLVWTFTTLDEIALEKPNNNSVNQALNVNLQWDNGVSGFKKFDYQIDIHEDFSTPTTYITELYKVPAEDLKYGTKYYWRMRGRHDYDTTNWSEVWNFTTWGNVNLTSPVEGADSVELKPQLKWSQIQGTAGYEVEYSSDSTFAISEINHVVADDDVTSPSFTILYALDAGTTYFWRVKAYTEIDTSDYSTVGSFITMPAQGINDNYFGNASLSIYPNPARNVLNINLNNSENVDVELEIIDLIGQAVITRPLHFRAGESQQQILLNDISNGVYMVKFIKDDAIYTSKLIINK